MQTSLVERGEPQKLMGKPIWFKALMIPSAFIVYLVWVLVDLYFINSATYAIDTGLENDPSRVNVRNNLSFSSMGASAFANSIIPFAFYANMTRLAAPHHHGEQSRLQKVGHTLQHLVLFSMAATVGYAAGNDSLKAFTKFFDKEELLIPGLEYSLSAASALVAGLGFLALHKDTIHETSDGQGALSTGFVRGFNENFNPFCGFKGNWKTTAILIAAICGAAFGFYVFLAVILFNGDLTAFSNASWVYSAIPILPSIIIGAIHANSEATHMHAAKAAEKKREIQDAAAGVIQSRNSWSRAQISFTLLSIWAYMSGLMHGIDDVSATFQTIEMQIKTDWIEKDVEYMTAIRGGAFIILNLLLLHANALGFQKMILGFLAQTRTSLEMQGVNGTDRQPLLGGTGANGYGAINDERNSSQLNDMGPPPPLTLPADHSANSDTASSESSSSKQHGSQPNIFFAPTPTATPTSLAFHTSALPPPMSPISFAATSQTLPANLPPPPPPHHSPVFK